MRVSARARGPVSGAEARRLARAVLVAEGVRRAMLSVTLVGRRSIRSLNRRHLGRDRDTDVIAFALAPSPDPRTRRPVVVGDVYVCVPVAAAQAARFSSTPGDEVRRLIIHGVLHVLGYRHPETGNRATSPMWRRQERYLARLTRRR